jgi:RNA polymerase sporulation-specific sigma factor
VKTFLVPLTQEEEEECLGRLREGQREAWEELILHNMRLVAHVAKKYGNAEEDQEDLISIGTIGLIKAADSFRPDYGSRFATYAIRCIDNEMLMYFRSKKKTRGEVSLFEPIGTDKEGNQIQLVDVLEYHDCNVAELVTMREQLKKIRDHMEEVLDERELFIIVRRYGFGGREELTQREIARELGISRSYVSRIEKKALRKLQKIICNN